MHALIHCCTLSGNIVSIAFFNFAGISVTKEISATTRMVLDSLRTIVIWVVSLAVLWQPFAWNQFLVQAVGFILLLAGMCIYNNIVCAPAMRKVGIITASTNDDREPVLSESTSGESILRRHNLRPSDWLFFNKIFCPSRGPDSI